MSDLLATNVQAAQHAAPQLDPKTIVAAAQAAMSPADAVGNAQATAAYGNTAAMAAQMGTLSLSQQHTVWKALSGQQQSQLSAAGYQLPPDPQQPHAGSGFFGTIAHALGTAGHAVVHAGGDILNAMASPLRAMQHFERAAEYGSETMPQWGWAPLDPANWAKAWRATTNGASTFEPTVLRQLRQTTDAQTLHLAEQIASGIPEQQVVNGFPQAQRQQIVQSMASGEFKQLVGRLNNAHMSFGRWVLGDGFMNSHPLAGKILSGGIDAAYDVAEDPVRIGGSAAKGISAARWGLDGTRVAADAVPNATAYEELLQRPAVQRMVSTAGKMVEQGRYDQLRVAFPTTLGKVSSQLAEQGIDSTDKLNEWLSSQAGMKAILTGEAARVTKAGPMMPHLSTLGWAKANAKVALQTGLDKIIDRPSGLADVQLDPHDLAGLGIAPGPKTPPVNLGDLAEPNTDGAVASTLRNGASGVARMVRKLSTLTPTKGYLDLAPGSGSADLERTLLYSLPRNIVNQITNLYDTTPDAAQRFRIAKGAIAQMLHMAGAYTTAGGSEAADSLLSAMDDSFRNTAYSVGGQDKMGETLRTGILSAQQNTRIHLPSLTAVHQAAQIDQKLAAFGITVPGSQTALAMLHGAGRAATNFMNLWRPAVLARIGFPLRVAIDENGNQMIRNGVMPYVAAKVALWGAKGEAKALQAAKAAEEGLTPDQTLWAKAVATVAHHVPGPVLAKVQSTRDLASSVFGEAAWRAFAKVDPTVTREDFYRAAGLIHDRWDGIGPVVSAVHHAGGGYDDADQLLQIMRNGKPTTWRWKNTGTYSEATAADPLFRLKWHAALGMIGDSPEARAVLRSINMSSETQFRRALEVIKSDEFAADRAKSVRSYMLPDGRQVGVDPGVTEEKALRSWARKVVAHVNSQVKSSDGTVLQHVVDEMLANEGAPSVDALEQVAPHQLPAGTFGPDIVATSPVERGLSRFMNNLAGMMDNLARQPNMTHATARALKQLEPWVDELAPDATAEAKNKLLGDLAVDRAMHELKPFIHSPELKTQFEVLHRTAMPFLFAQRQFLQRWARTFADSPAGIRKAQLLMNGLNTSGMVHTDAQGNQYFIYPGTATVTRFLSDTLGLFGIHASLPVDVPFTGELKYIMPGLSNPLTPSVGPFVAVPLKALTGLFPELNSTEQALLQQGASQSYWQQIMPSTVSRLIQVVTSQGADAQGGQMASMMMHAMQQAEATGHGLPANATPEQQQQYLDRVTNWARVNLFMRAALGFVAPASPSQLYDPKNMNGRLQTLLSELPYDQALTEFLRENPDATPYTVFMSQSAGGAPLPSAQVAGKWIDQNAQFVQAHQQAAGWLIPQTLGANQPFDPAVYREQISYGLRNSKTPRQFLQDVAMAPGLQTYYKAYDVMKQAETQAGTNSARKAQVRTAWSQWEASYLATQPLVADYLTSGAKAVQRDQTIRDLNAALQDPTVPQGPQTDHVAEMVQGYDMFEQAYTALDGNYSSTASREKTRLQTAFEDWANSYVQQHPDVSTLWTVLLQPQVHSMAYAYPINATTGVAA